MSIPARSWSRMASWVASSNVSFTSVCPYSPALILSRAVQNQPGKPWLPITCVGIMGRVMCSSSLLAHGAMISHIVADATTPAGLFGAIRARPFLEARIGILTP